MKSCMLVIFILIALCASFVKTCNPGINNRSMYGVDPIQSFNTDSWTNCCNACLNSSKLCGAWYHVLRHSGWNCDLFAQKDISNLKYGNCSKWQPTPTTCTSGFIEPSLVHVDINVSSSKWKISPYLSSMSIVYSWAPDKMYANHTLASWARTHNVATARFPAGEASYWNWENPSGYMGKSTLDPNWVGPPAPTEDWMGLDEYLDLCKEVDMMPLIGVNYNCKNKEWVSLNESIARAVRQVQFVKKHGFTGALYYIGNEDDASQHASRIKAHAVAMKKEDPTLKVFWNDNKLQPAGLKKFLQETGDVMDGAEFHGKWPFGGKPGLPAMSVEQWLDEVPLVEHKSNQTWRQKIKGLRKAAQEAGRPDFLLANNEYGLGKPPAFSGFDRYTKGLVVVEFALEMYVGGYDIAAFWDNSDGGSLDHSDQMLTSTADAYRFNPMHFGLEMLAKAVNFTMLEITTTDYHVHGFAALSPYPNDPATPLLLCYLFNKNKNEQHVQIILSDTLITSGAVAESLIDTDDHWGQLVSIQVNCTSNQLICDVTLPSLSFSLITFKIHHASESVSLRSTTLTQAEIFVDI